MSLSRRDFLRVLGISAGAYFAGSVSAFAFPSADQQPLLLARRFQPLDGRLDAVEPILGLSGDDYHLPSGILHRHQAQPIPANRYSPPGSVDISINHIGEWVQACAPVASLYRRADVRTWSSHVGHGAVARVVDLLPPAQSGAVAWAALAFSPGQPPIWSQAHWWQPVETFAPPLDRAVVEINQGAAALTVWRGDDPVMRSPVAFGRDFAAVQGKYRLHERAFSRESLPQPSPYTFALTSRQIIGGVWWHNRFGTQERLPGHAVQMPVYAAAALFQLLPDDVEIHVT